jgi:hypothetical protein
MKKPIRFGVQTAPQNTTWRERREKEAVVRRVAGMFRRNPKKSSQDCWWDQVIGHSSLVIYYLSRMKLSECK